MVDLHAYLETLYTWAAANTMAIADHLAEALNILFKKYPKLLKKFYLLGIQMK